MEALGITTEGLTDVLLSRPGDPEGKRIADQMFIRIGTDPLNLIPFAIARHANKARFAATAEEAAAARLGFAPNSGGRGLIGLVMPGGTIDDALKAHYLDIARSPQMAAAVERYNKVARFLGQKPSASIDDIVAALGKDVTYSRVGHIRSGVFTPGNHPGGTQFWIQGDPTTAYGRRVGRHELGGIKGDGSHFWDWSVSLCGCPRGR